MISQKELTDHNGYLADERRIATYRAAFAEIVSPRDVVLDLGAGAGVLGYFTCEAPAGEVGASFVSRVHLENFVRKVTAVVH